MRQQAAFTVGDIKSAFPDLRLICSDDPEPAGGAILLPHALLGVIDLKTATLTVSLSVTWHDDKEIEFSSKDEADAMEAIDSDLRPEWEAAGFVLDQDGMFDSTEKGCDPEYCVDARISIPTLSDLTRAIEWITNAEVTSAYV